MQDHEMSLSTLYRCVPSADMQYFANSTVNATLSLGSATCRQLKGNNYPLIKLLSKIGTLESVHVYNEYF